MLSLYTCHYFDANLVAEDANTDIEVYWGTFPSKPEEEIIVCFSSVEFTWKK